MSIDMPKRMSEDRIQAGKRATSRARALLKPGDKLGVTRCADTKVTDTFKGWEGDWIITSKLSDVHANHVYELNGQPYNFRDA